MLVENHNDPDNSKLIVPCSLTENGNERQGFRFNQNVDITVEVSQLYAKHIRKEELMDDSFQSEVLLNDLRKFYFRATMELLGKYFTKRGKYTFLYEKVHLFVPGSSLKEAENRIRQMKTKRKRETEWKRRFLLKILVIMRDTAPNLFIWIFGSSETGDPCCISRINKTIYWLYLWRISRKLQSKLCRSFWYPRTNIQTAIIYIMLN